MLLYHGSNMAVEKPEVNAGRRALDFGAGFYLTSNRDQAERWAQAVVRRRQSGCAMLNCFEFDRSIRLCFEKSLTVLHYTGSEVL